MYFYRNVPMINISIVIYFDTCQTLIFKCESEYQIPHEVSAFYHKLKEKIRHNKSISKCLNLSYYFTLFL